MKKNLKITVTLCALLFMGIIASAINPIGLLLKNSPPPPDTVQVIISLGGHTCESLGCHDWYVSVYTDGPNNTNPVYSTFVYTGWSTYTGAWTLADPTADKICVKWHFVSDGSECDPILPDKICCVDYTGSGRYNITCNPCDQ